MIIKYYDSAYKNGKFSCKQVCTQCKSVIWTKNFYDVGSFEIIKPVVVPEIGDIVVHGSHCGIVCRIIESKQDIKVYGYDLKGLLHFRYLPSYSTSEKVVDKIIKDVASVSLCQDKRKIEGLTVEPYNELRTEEITQEYAIEKMKASDLVKNISSVYEIGWDIVFQEEKLTFCTKKGADLSDKVVFSRRFKNIENLEYDTSIFDSANVVYDLQSMEMKKLCWELKGLINSEGEVIDSANINRAENIIDEINDKIGVKIKLNYYAETAIDELVASLNDIKFNGEEATGINRRECGLSGDNNTIEEYLKEKEPTETLTGTANTKMIYGNDYQIGDYVTVMHNDIYTIKQITKVDFVYEACGSKVVPTFGELKENILKKIVRKV